MKENKLLTPYELNEQYFDILSTYLKSYPFEGKLYFSFFASLINGRAGGEAHSHVGKQKLINGTQLSYIISPPCVNTLLAVRAGLLKQIFQYETKSKIQMEW